jgi:hypothetical protein
LDNNNDAFALLVPTNWAWPLEGQRIDDAFPKYRAWVNSGRPTTTEWYYFPRTDRYKDKSLNTGGVQAPVPVWKDIDDFDANDKSRYVYVFDPKLFTYGQNAFLAPTSVATTAAVITQNTPTPMPSASGTSNLYPIALNKNTLTGKNPGDSLGDIYCGGSSGNFGWLSWDGDGSAPRLATSLEIPGDSDTYENPNDEADHVIDIGDWIPGNTGISNSSAVRKNLNTLMSYDIVVPVWDAVTGSGANTQYKVYAFAKVRITDYVLPNQNRITATYLGYATPQGAPSTQPTVAPTPTPTPTATPTPAPSSAPTASPTASPTAAPTATPGSVPHSNDLLNFAIHASKLSGKRVGQSLGTVEAGTGANNFCWVTWNGNNNESTWRANCVNPGRSETYNNPNNSSDHHIDPGDRLVAFTDVPNNGTNRGKIDAIDNTSLVIPVFSSVVSGGQVAVSGFCKVKITDRALNGSNDELTLTFMGYCESDGSSL